MEIVQGWIGRRGGERTGKGSDWVARYIERSNAYCGCRCQMFAREQDFWADGAESQPRARGRTFVVLLDGRGRQMSSESFAGQMGQLREEGVRRILFGVGAADGWGKESLARADLVVSLGSMTLPHELARLVLAEQVYRALTILAGHPYHLGH